MQPKALQVLFEAIHHGKYDFEDFLRDDIMQNCKPVKRKHRTTYRPEKKLKRFLVFLNTVLFEHLELNERVVYSYRKGRNPHEAALPHRFSRAFLQTDIKDFFGSIDRALVKTTILSQADRIPISDLVPRVERILDLTTIKGVIPLGFPTSPRLAMSASLLSITN